MQGQLPPKCANLFVGVTAAIPKPKKGTTEFDSCPVRTDGFAGDTENQVTSGCTAIAEGDGMGSGFRQQKNALEPWLSFPMKGRHGSEWTNLDQDPIHLSALAITDHIWRSCGPLPQIRTAIRLYQRHDRKITSHDHEVQALSE